MSTKNKETDFIHDQHLRTKKDLSMGRWINEAGPDRSLSETFNSLAIRRWWFNLWQNTAGIWCDHVTLFILYIYLYIHSLVFQRQSKRQRRFFLRWYLPLYVLPASPHPVNRIHRNCDFSLSYVLCEENYIMRSWMICTPQPILYGW